MRIEIKRDTLVNGKLAKRGSEHEVSDADARYLIAKGKAVKAKKKKKTKDK